MDLWPQLISAGLRGTTLVIRFGLVLWLARTLPIESLGLFGLYGAGLQLAASLLTLDVYAHTARLLLQPDTDRQRIMSLHLGFVSLVILCIGLPATALFYISSPEIEIFLAFLFLLQLPLEIISTDIGRLLVPLGNPFGSNIIIFTRSALWVIPLILFFEFGCLKKNIYTVIYFWSVGSLISSLFSIFLLRSSIGRIIFPKVDLSWIHTAFFSSSLFLISTLIFRSILGLDKFLIERFLGLETVGIYTVFAAVSLGVLGLVESGVSAWQYPHLLRNIQNSDKTSTRKSIIRFTRQNTVATLGLMCIILFFFPLIIKLYLDPTYTANILTFYVIAGGVTVYCVSIPFHYVIYGMRKDQILLCIYSLSLAVMVIWAIGFMQPLGVLGGGIMLLLALSVISIARIVAALNLLKKI